VPSEQGVLCLGSYFQFWALVYLVVTVWLILFKREDAEKEEAQSMASAYYDIWRILRLPNMKAFVVILLTAKIGFIANDAVTGFKLLEKGFLEEDLALTVLINFPLQIIFGYYAARWSTAPRRLRPWLLAFYGRLLMPLVAMWIISNYPKEGLTSGYFALVIASSVLSSFLRCVYMLLYKSH